MSSFASKSTPNPLPSTESSTTAITNSTPETKLPLDSKSSNLFYLGLFSRDQSHLDFWINYTNLFSLDFVPRVQSHLDYVV